MKTLRTILIAVLCVGVSLGAAPIAALADADTDHLWIEVKQALRQGAYRDALESLEVLLQHHPDDPRAQLYRSLCELRLEAPPQFEQVSPDALARLNARLKDEEQGQRRARAQQKALEREVKREQVRWDRELKMMEQAAQRDARSRRQQEQAQAVAMAQAQQAPTPRRAAPTAHEAEPTREAEPEIEERHEPQRVEAPAMVEAPEGAVSLAPVTVTTGAETPEAPSPVTPSLAGRPAPPAGAVQINARQMSVSPDRKIAVADGDVEVVYETAILTCDHVTVFTDTKDAYAEGHVRLEDGHQVFRGEIAQYNLQTKKGRFLEGTMSSPPWHEHGRSVEHIAEGVYEVSPGYVTSCELEPPHFKFYGRRAIVFAEDQVARAKNVAFLVDHVPFLYLPWMVWSNKQSPFFIIPGKKKPWEEFVLGGYRYALPGPMKQEGTIKLDWRRAFGWGVGVDHSFDSERLGRGLLKLYYNEEPNRRRHKDELPKGADDNRYRILWRHRWDPYPDTTMITDIQEYSDVDFRRELLFREEYTEDDQVDSFVSVVKNTPDFTVSGLARKRMNRFQDVDELLPQVTVDARQQRIGDTWFFSESHLDVANWQRKRANSERDSDVVRVDWLQQLSYALNWFRPINLTPKTSVRQTYYTKDIQGSDRNDALRDFVAGQFTMGLESSLKLFRVFPIVTNALGLDINMLRHVLTPTINYLYAHEPTVRNALLDFPAAPGPSNTVTFGLENKLQTKRPRQAGGKPTSVDLARFIIALPYSFHGRGNEVGGQLGDWTFDLELYPWRWMRLESDWTTLSHVDPLTQDSRTPRWNLDLVMIGGEGELNIEQANEVQAPAIRTFEPGAQGGLEMLPKGQWYLGYGHRYSTNDKNEDVLQADWRLSPKWQIGTFHRFTWKEVVDGSKRYNNLREYQYTLRRDLHDWIGELVYRVDREFGEELFLTFTLKAYPNMPIGLSESYHEPKFGSQSSPFSPLHVQ